MPDDATPAGFAITDGPPSDTRGWGEPDRNVTRSNRRPPPPLPMEVFRDDWARWIDTTAKAAACPLITSPRRSWLQLPC